MTKAAIVRHNGLFYGGTEKFLQIMAAKTSDIFDVDYYTTDLMRSEDRENYLVDNSVNVIKFKLGYNYNRFPLKYFDFEWRDFWRRYNERSYDVTQVTNFGWQEKPYNQFKSNVCEFTVFPPYVEFRGVSHHILNSEWLRQKWIKTGGDPEKSTAIPVPVEKTSSLNLRESLGIEKDTLVCGFHQRADDNIFSPVQLEAYSRIEDEFDTMMLVLNGSKLYKEQADKLCIKHIKFIDYVEEVSPFLNTLDIYTHGRKDGETYGMVLAEAMLHGLPVMSHLTPYYNAMRSVIKDGGVVVNNINQYSTILGMLLENPSLRNEYGRRARFIAEENYTYKVVIPKIEEVWRKVANE
jgi:hypothetical protein